MENPNLKFILKALIDDIESLSLGLVRLEAASTRQDPRTAEEITAERLTVHYTALRKAVDALPPEK